MARQRDRARITTWFQQSILPDTVIEESSIYEDRQVSQMTFIYEKISIADVSFPIFLPILSLLIIIIVPSDGLLIASVRKLNTGTRSLQTFPSSRFLAHGWIPCETD